MEKIEFKCEICGRVFKKWSSITRHIVLSKDHPSLEEYNEKYPVSDEVMKEYHKEYKKAKKEEDDKLLDDDKKTYVVRSDTPLVHVADMGLSNAHSLIAINSEEYCSEFIKLLPITFSRTNIHLCIMGPNASKLKDIIPDGLTTLLLVDSVAFNYSLAINLLLKPIYEKFPLAKISICDGWTIFSSIQVFKYEMSSVNWENEFVTINTVFDYKEDPINLGMDSSRLLSSILNRLRNMRDFNYHIPIVVCRAKYLLDIESGLEEDLFTEFSRFHLRNQLITAGLIEKVSTENKGLVIRPRTSNIKSEQVDKNLIESIKPRMNNYIFIPSNHGIECGDLNRVKQIVIDKNIPIWRHNKYKEPLTKIYKIGKTKEKEKIDKEPVVEVALTNISENLNNKDKVLLMIAPTIRDAMGATPLIRKLYEKFGPVDILTKDKTNPINSIIKNYMVRKIYDINDLKNKFLSLQQYGPNIIRTIDCKIGKLEKKVEILSPVNIYDNIVATNYSIMDPYIKELPNPYCNFEPFKAYPNMFLVVNSANTDFNIDTRLWSCLDTIGSRIGNHRDVHVCFMSLIGENKLFLTDKFKIRKNFHVFDNVTPVKASGMINSCKLFLTMSDSQTQWLSWALNTPTILLDIDSEVPERNNETRVFIEKRTSLIDFDSIIEHIWSIL